MIQASNLISYLNRNIDILIYSTNHFNAFAWYTMQG
jgi:hypothetical protein